MTTRIEWADRFGIGQSGWDGEVNGKRLFTIERSVSRGDGWKLRTQLPFAVRPETLVNEDSEILKELAERILVAFVKKIGAVFPEDQTDEIKQAASKIMGMVETQGRANGPGLWLAAITLDPSLNE